MTRADATDDASLRFESSPGARTPSASSPAAGTQFRDATSVASGLGRAFTHGRPALIGYVMGGYPTHAGCLEAMRILAESGVDLIELGVPYTDPLADGPVIRDAADAARAAAGGTYGLSETIALAGEFVAGAGDDAPPVALMTYLNPLMRGGMAAVAQNMLDSGVGGVIVPDLPPDMAAPWLAASKGLDTVFLVAPTSTPGRMEKVGTASRGFVYCVSTTGVTGERSELPVELADLVERVREHTSLPIAVGFGVSTPEQAAAVSHLADGVVVGSAIVKRQRDTAELRVFVSELAAAVHGHASVVPS